MDKRSSQTETRHSNRGDSDELKRHPTTARFDIRYTRTNAAGFTIRLCGGCGEWKPRDSDHFHRHTASPDGMQSWCKACINNRANRGAREARALHDRAVRVLHDTAQRLAPDLHLA